MIKNEHSERRHITISLPKELIDEIKLMIKNPEYKLGYDTHTEFCKEAIRQHLKNANEQIAIIQARKDHESVVDK